VNFLFPGSPVFFSPNVLLKRFQSMCGWKFSGKVWLIGSRLSSRVQRVDWNFPGKVRQIFFNQGLPGIFQSGSDYKFSGRVWCIFSARPLVGEADADSCFNQGLIIFLRQGLLKSFQSSVVENFPARSGWSGNNF